MTSPRSNPDACSGRSGAQRRGRQAACGGMPTVPRARRTAHDPRTVHGRERGHPRQVLAGAVHLAGSKPNAECSQHALVLSCCFCSDPDAIYACHMGECKRALSCCPWLENGLSCSYPRQPSPVRIDAGAVVGMAATRRSERPPDCLADALRASEAFVEERG